MQEDVAKSAEVCQFLTNYFAKIQTSARSFCRSQKILQNGYLLANIGTDTVENGSNLTKVGPFWPEPRFTPESRPDPGQSDFDVLGRCELQRRSLRAAEVTDFAGRKFLPRLRSNRRASKETSVIFL